MAKAKKRKGALPAVPTENQVQDAVAIIRRAYYADVADLGDSLIQEIQDGEIGDREIFSDRLHEDVDGAARVIYTWQAQLGVLVSENDDAYFEELGETLECDGSVPYEKLMFYAMQRDVVEYMVREGCDPDDDDVYGEEGEEED
jgi:hypothetical protein